MPRRKPLPLAVTADPVLLRFRAALDGLYGSKVECVVLFGSRARGGGPDSDYDAAIFLKDFQDRWSEVDRLIPLVTDQEFPARSVPSYNSATGISMPISGMDSTSPSVSAVVVQAVSPSARTWTVIPMPVCSRMT